MKKFMYVLLCNRSCVFFSPANFFPPLPFALMCPTFAARYLEANIVFSPFLPSILLCNLCVVIVYVFSSCLHFHFSILDSFIDFVFDCLTNFTVMF